MKDQKIFAYMHLEDLIPEVESDLKKTIDEREKLGLSIPEKYQVLTTYSSHEQTSGTAHYSEDLGTICLNILSPLFHELSEEDYSKLMFINNYYDNSRKVFTHEDWIIQSLTEPKGLFDKFETEAFKDEEHLEGFKKNFDATGTTYDQYKEFIIENSEKASTFFNDLLPKLKEGFKKSEEPISTLRHEFDHVDFMENSKLHKKINDEGKEVEKLRKEFWEKQNPETSKKYSEAYYEWTSKKMQLDSLVESRAFFFDCIESGKFENADLELEKNRVYSKILFHYIEGSFVPQILDAVIASAWSQRAMNQETSDYLFKFINTKIGLSDANKYNIEDEDMKNLHRDTINQILYETLPQWKASLAKLTQISVDALATAFKEDPSRLKEANEAETIEEYLKICDPTLEI